MCNKRPRAGALLAVVLLALSACRGARPAGAQTAPDPFVTLRGRLAQALLKRGAEPEKHAFHFVVLMNSNGIGNPEGSWMESMYSGLLRHYLVAGDMLSFAPFQNHIRQDYTASGTGRNNWNRLFSAADADQMQALMPRSRDASPEESSGHDPEGALLVALKQAKQQTYTLFIVLSNDPFSVASNNSSREMTADTAEFKQALEASGQEEVITDKYPASSEEARTLQSGKACLYYRVYMPKATSETSLPALKSPRADQIREQERLHQWQPVPADPAPVAAPPPPAVPPPSEAGRERAASAPDAGAQSAGTSSGGSATAPLAALVALAALGITALWSVRANAKYDVNVGSQVGQVGHLTKTVTPRRPVVIGGPGAENAVKKNANRNIAILEEAPKSVEIARLIATLGGKVVLQGISPYTLTTTKGKGDIAIPSGPPVDITVSKDGKPVCKLMIGPARAQVKKA